MLLYSENILREISKAFMSLTGSFVAISKNFFTNLGSEKYPLYSMQNFLTVTQVHVCMLHHPASVVVLNCDVA